MSPAEKVAMDLLVELLDVEERAADARATACASQADDRPAGSEEQAEQVYESAFARGRSNGLAMGKQRIRTLASEFAKAATP